jgi:hypothetical protein
MSFKVVDKQQCIFTQRLIDVVQRPDGSEWVSHHFRAIGKGFCACSMIRTNLTQKD